MVFFTNNDVVAVLTQLHSQPMLPRFTQARLVLGENYASGGQK